MGGLDKEMVKGIDGNVYPFFMHCNRQETNKELNRGLVEIR